jgi:polar amino acid transport system substrate-binding protein
MVRLSRGAALMTAIALLAVACGSGTASPSVAPTQAPPTTAPTTAPTTPPTTAPTAWASESVAPATETPAPTTAVVATIPSDQLLVPGHLEVCSDIPYPPLEYLDDQGNPIGSDMEIAAGIAARLGLELQVQNTVFDYIIAAVNGGKCDIIISDQNLTTDRIAQVDMIPYFEAGQAFVVAKGNPEGINTELDVCGKKVGAETSTTEIQYLQGTDLYKSSGGLKKKCTDAGMQPPQAVNFEKDSDAFLALAAGQVDAYFADLPVVAYYVQQQPDQFEQAPITPLSPIKAGISVPKGHTDVENAVMTALIAMMNDGSYQQILDKYDVGSGALQPSDVVVNQP